MMKNGPVEDGEESCEGSGRDREDVEEGGFGGPLADCGECCREGRVLVDGELGFQLGTTPLRSSSSSSSFHSCAYAAAAAALAFDFLLQLQKARPCNI